MNGPRYYDRQNQPLEMMEWARLFEDREHAIVKQTRHKEKGREFWLSTVWLGLDHNYLPNGKPLIFETMAMEYKPTFTEVVANEVDWNWQERYETEDEALEARDPWRVVTEDKPDIISLFVKALARGGKSAKLTKRRSGVLSWLRRSKHS